MLNFTAIDFETANAGRASACSVGLAIVEDGKITRCLHQLIRPDPLCFDPFNISIHGITPDDVCGAPCFAEFWPELWSNVSGPLVAHNAAFDMSVLRHALDQSSSPYPQTDYFCTRVIARQAWPGRLAYALKHIAHGIGVSFAHHNAQEDARACALIAIAACRQLNAPSLYDLQDACGLRAGRLFPGGYYPCSAQRATRVSAEQRSQFYAAGTASSTPLPGAHGLCSGKAFVFTGKMSSMPGKDAMKAVVERGGICYDTVQNDTDYLVLGQEGFAGYQAGHKSSKMKQAEQMRNRGLPIEILSEADFVCML